MQNVSTKNEIPNYDNIQLSYNHETRNFDFLIGKTLRQNNMILIGKIVDVEYIRDGYHHDNAIAVTDTGKRFNCRKLGFK
jgi:hypothetical protein